MNKISMKTPLVEMDGDEMTRVIWKWIKEIIILPHVDLKTDYYDLGLPERDRTLDNVTLKAAEACKKLGVGVKCATITPNTQRVKEYNLTKMWKSPNGTIRAVLDGTVFRAPIIVDGITPLVPSWTSPIIIARHAYGDVYRDVEAVVPEGAKAELVITLDGVEKRTDIFNFEKSAGVVLGQHNIDNSIRSFAKSCFAYALSQKKDLWFSSKDTISKTYDGRFKAIFEEEFLGFKDLFAEKGIEYFYTLIDDAVARVMRSNGGFIWACKNYDGDVMSDMVATAFGSLAMMTSVLVSPQGNYEFEAAHGTVTRHFYRYKQGENTSTNPIATLFAWTGALDKRGELDDIPELCAFAKKVEKACISTVESGKMTKDLALIFHKDGIMPEVLDTRAFLYEVAAKLK